MSSLWIRISIMVTQYVCGPQPVSHVKRLDAPARVSAFVWRLKINTRYLS